MKHNNNFAERLSDALAERNMKPLELSRLTGIDKGAISNYLNGKYKPKTDKLYIISNVLGINEAWLLGSDEVPMQKTTVKTDTIYHLTEDEVTLIEQYRKADNETQCVIRRLLKTK